MSYGAIRHIFSLVLLSLNPANTRTGRLTGRRTTGIEVSGRQALERDLTVDISPYVNDLQSLRHWEVQTQ